MADISTTGRPLPTPTPTTQPFFDGAAAGRVMMQRCPRDGFFFYPRSHCPACPGTDWQWEETSGRGKVHAFTIDRIGHDPLLRDRIPFVIAVVELDEGPRMVGNILDCDPEKVGVGMPVIARFEKVDEITLLSFAPG